jgi:RimJ/RimL family protein N-acetyltransferase
MEKIETRGGGSMTGFLLTGKLIELAPIDLENDLAIWEKWNRDSDYQRLLDDCPANQSSATMIKDWFEKDDFNGTLFMIHTLDEHKTIGFIELRGYDWVARNAWVGIAIGDSEYRNKGIGTEAMALMLNFAFRTQNLHRVNLCVFDFNKRAIHCYEKSGFKYEGTERECIYKDDHRWDVLNMGVLKTEWEAMQLADAAD